MKPNIHLFLVLCFLAATVALAQTQPPPDGDGKEMGGYKVQQSTEFGYRFTDVTGNLSMYDTLINQQQGPRVLEQSLSIHDATGTGPIFDDLTISSFGWGGDPENVARAKISKFRFYDLNFVFRRDQNYFDYDLLANPLNPSTSNPAIPVDNSPHSMYNVRRMYDFDLTILPQSKFSIRLGMTHNRSNGPTFSSVHEGTDAMLNQAWSVTDNLFRFGIDYKGLSKTTLSYDQYLDYAKNDTDYSLASFATFPLPDGTPVEFGLPWNTASNTPCSAPLQVGVANPACNGFLSYLRNQKVRTTTPTEQLRFVSNYVPRVNLVAQATYSSTDLTSPYLEIFNGLITRSGTRQDEVSGPVNNRRVATTADLGMTILVTKSISISDSFRYDNWHLPGSWDSTEVTYPGIPVGTPPAVTLLSPLGAPTTTASLISTYFGQRTFYNVALLQYNPDRTVGLHVGYKVVYRNTFKAEPEVIDPEGGFEPFEGDNITTNQQGPVFGVWWRPTDKLRVNVEAEALTTIGCQACPNADEIFITRMSPRQQETYRGRVSYKPAHWADISASVTWWDARNGAIDVQSAQHNRNAGATLSLFPNERLSVDLSYNYTDLLQDAYICYNGTYLAPGTVQNGCPTYDPAASSSNNNPNWIYSNYNTNTNYFSATVMIRPVKRLTAHVGYGLIKTDGSATVLNPLQPLGPVQFTYQQPLGLLSYEFVKDWSVNAYWNYDQYNEASFAGPTLPRYFHDNRAFMSLKYAF